MKSIVAIATGLSLALGSAAASAQVREPLGDQGQFVIGAERLTGVFVNRWAIEQELGALTQTNTQSTTTVGLLGSSATGPLGGDKFGAFSSMPRLSFDYFVIDGLSIGGSLFYYSNAGEAEVEQEGPGANPRSEADLDTDRLFVFSPRVGYAIAFSDSFAFWPRGGITYVSAGVEEDNGEEVSASVWALSLEAMFAITPIPHFAILLGPYLDVAPFGGVDIDDPGEPTVENDLSYLSFGAAAGIGVYF